MTMNVRGARRAARSAVAAAAVLASMHSPALHAQTITGRLLDVETGHPIDLGLVVMLSESGDSVASTITSPDGSFSVGWPEPGAFTLLASAWGYAETRSDAFALDRGERTSVTLRLEPEPLPMEEIFVGVDRPTFDHPLVRNGFVRRFRRGLGHFLTPHDIENSPARTTEALFVGVPGVVVSSPGGGDYVGERVRMLNATGSFCYPAVYVDGIRTEVDVWTGLTISTVAPLHTIEAVEIYRRSAEIPVEYPVTQGPLARRGNVPTGGCGVVLFWTKQGPAFGTAAGGGARSAVAGVPGVGLAGQGSLPPVDDVGPPPVPGERIRVELGAEAALGAGLTSPWEGTFVGVREDELVTGDPERLEGPVTVPLGEVEALQVLRERDHGHVVRRGLVAGALFGGGVWLALRTICRFNGCAEGGEKLPAAGLGLLVGLMVAGQGPGEHWVAAPVPAREPGGGLGVELSGRFAMPRR